MHLCQAMPSTQPVEIGKFGGQTDQRQYIDKTELLSVPLTPFSGREWTDNTTNSTVPSVEQLKLLLTRGKNEEKYNSTTTNSNVVSARNEIAPSKMGPKYKLIKPNSDQ